MFPITDSIHHLLTIEPIDVVVDPLRDQPIVKGDRCDLDLGSSIAMFLVHPPILKKRCRPLACVGHRIIEEINREAKRVLSVGKESMKKEDGRGVVAFTRGYVVVRLADAPGQYATVRWSWFHRYFGGKSPKS